MLLLGYCCFGCCSMLPTPTVAKAVKGVVKARVVSARPSSCQLLLLLCVWSSPSGGSGMRGKVPLAPLPVRFPRRSFFVLDGIHKAGGVIIDVAIRLGGGRVEAGLGCHGVGAGPLEAGIFLLVLTDGGLTCKEALLPVSSGNHARCHRPSSTNQRRSHHADGSGIMVVVVVVMLAPERRLDRRRRQRSSFGTASAGCDGGRADE